MDHVKLEKYPFICIISTVKRVVSLLYFKLFRKSTVSRLSVSFSIDFHNYVYISRFSSMEKLSSLYIGDFFINLIKVFNEFYRRSFENWGIPITQYPFRYTIFYKGMLDQVMHLAQSKESENIGRVVMYDRLHDIVNKKYVSIYIILHSLSKRFYQTMSSQ